MLNAKTRLSIRHAAAVTVAFAAAATAQPPAEAKLALVHATVIDGTGAAARRDQTVLVAEGRIVAVGDAAQVAVPAGATVVDATGRFLIPGLWDMHVHTRYEGIDHLGLLIANGVTTARDMGAPWPHVARMNGWRDEVAWGSRIGPRLLTAGPLLDGEGSIWSHAAEVVSPDEGRRAVRRLVDEGADFAKVYSRLTRETFLAIADEAEHVGLDVVGHVPAAVPVGEASSVGLRSIEHLTGIFEAVSDDDDDLPAAGAAIRLDTAKLDRVAALLVRNGTAVVPTLSIFWVRMANARQDEAAVNAASLRYVPAPYREVWRTGRRPSVDDTTARFDYSVEMVGLLHARGVSVLAGTDTVKPFFVPGFALHDELGLLVDAGLSEMEVIEAATRAAARSAGLDDVGTIEPGMVADLVLLDADPLERIGNTREIAAVVVGGRLLERDDLDRMLDEIAADAASWDGVPTGR